MRLDCIESQSGEWVIVNLDDDYKEIARGEMIDNAWFCCSIVLAEKINTIELVITGRCDG